MSAAAAAKVGRDVSRGNLLISGAKSLAFNPELLVGHGRNSRVVYIANCVRTYIWVSNDRGDVSLSSALARPFSDSAGGLAEGEEEEERNVGGGLIFNSIRIVVLLGRWEGIEDVKT